MFRNSLGGLLALALLSSCSVFQKELHTINVNDTYKYDLLVNINGIDYRGVGVLPHADTYLIKVDPPGRINRITFRTCHREIVADRDGRGWKDYEYSLSLIKGIEDQSACGLKITVFEEKKRRNAMARFSFEDTRAEYDFFANSVCNGKLSQKKAVSMCQSSKDLLQQIEFPTPVFVQSSGRCGALNGVANKFNYFMSEGECVYVFTSEMMSPNGKRYKHRLETVGYTDVPPIEVK